MTSDRVPRPAPGGPSAAIVVGAVVAASGTLVHRWDDGGWPVGLLVGLGAALAGAVMSRAAAGAGGVFLYGLAAVVTSQVMTFVRPGGDVLVTGEPISYAWLLGLPLSTVAAALTPRRWYSGDAVETRAPAGATDD